MKRPVIAQVQLGEWLLSLAIVALGIETMVCANYVGFSGGFTRDKAKGSPKFRFYALSDKVYRADVLEFAYECCKANGGAAGVDGQRFEDIEEYGLKRWLDELTQELKSRTYRPQPVRRV